MVKKRPTVISLFSGCGGSSLGYQWAGFKELLAIDFDKDAVETFRLNFPDVPCWQGDIREASGREIMDFCHIKPGELDVLDASPPCQGFSSAGKRMVADPRNDLFKEFTRLINELRPKIFIMENVPGLTKGKMRGRFNEIMRELRGTGYLVKCRLMNAKWYGVPQSRQRLIWMGVKRELGKEPLFPQKSSRVITVKKAIGKDGFVEYRRNYSKGRTDFGKVGFSHPSITITKTAAGKKFYFQEERHEPRLIEAWHRTKPGKYLWDPSRHTGSFTSCRLDRYKTSPTVAKVQRHWHYAEPRWLTDDETKIICSFPKDFKFNKRSSINLLGNAVMPKFMEAIAKTIKEGILGYAPIS
jgi:DNA (cytosine-5)-methyltransferase 1